MGAIHHPTYAAVADYLPENLRGCLLARSPEVTRFDTGFGLGGLALLLISRHRALGQSTDWEAARNVTWQCVLGVVDTDRPGGASLIEQVEVAQLLRSYANELDLAEATDALLPVLDQVIERKMQACFTAGQLDPYTGGFNPAFYLLLHHPQADRFRGLWLRHLPTALDLARHTPQGQYLVPSGISHGLAFYACFVGRYLERYPADAAFQHLAQDYLTALELRQLDPETGNGCFYQDGGHHGPGRLSLAYGDCGILFSAYRLATLLGQQARAAAFLDCLETTAARRTRNKTGISSDNLLYGRSGAWLFFARLGELSGREAFAGAAAHWRKALEPGLLCPAEELPEYPVYDYGAMKSFSLFEGVIGPPLTAYALATDPSFLYHLFYLH